MKIRNFLLAVAILLGLWALYPVRPRMLSGTPVTLQLSVESDSTDEPAQSKVTRFENERAVWLSFPFWNISAEGNCSPLQGLFLRKRLFVNPLETFLGTT